MEKNVKIFHNISLSLHYNSCLAKSAAVSIIVRVVRSAFYVESM